MDDVAVLHLVRLAFLSQDSCLACFDQAAGADHNLGVMSVGDDPLDGAGELVAGGEAGDQPTGEQDVVGLDLDE